MSFGVWRSCNKAEIQMRLGLTFPSRAHGKHGKQGFNFSKHMPRHMAAWHMANTAQGKHIFNFYKHIPQHMAHGSTWHMAKRDLILIITCHSTWHMAHGKQSTWHGT